MMGFWFVAFWLLADILLSLFLGWYWNCLFSLAVFGLGMLYIGLLQKTNLIQSHPMNVPSGRFSKESSGRSILAILLECSQTAGTK